MEKTDKQNILGVPFAPFKRLLPPEYEKNLSLPRGGLTSSKLPSARKVSRIVHQDANEGNKQGKFSQMVMQFGQFLDHDLTSTPQTRGFNHSLIRCCTEGSRMFLNPDLLHPDCQPIKVLSTDYFYSRHNATCMEFVRSSPAPRKDCSLGPRDQVWPLTQFFYLL